MSILCRVELMWHLPADKAWRPARELLGSEHDLLAGYLAHHQRRIYGGLFIDVDGVPWSTDDNVEDIRMTVVWYHALAAMLRGEASYRGWGPTYESGIQFDRFGDDVIIEDRNMYGRQILPVATLPIRELADHVSLEGLPLIEMSRRLRSQIAVVRATTVKHKAEMFARLDHLDSMLLTEEHDIPTIETLATLLQE